MNENFVSIKVDREERPDLDQIYMDAVQLLTGRGGWPLTMFLTPDGEAVLRRHLFSAGGSPGMPGFPRRADGDRRRLSNAAARHSAERRAADPALARSASYQASRRRAPSRLWLNARARAGASITTASTAASATRQSFPTRFVFSLFLRDATRRTATSNSPTWCATR